MLPENYDSMLIAVPYNTLTVSFHKISAEFRFEMSVVGGGSMLNGAL